MTKRVSQRLSGRQRAMAAAAAAVGAQKTVPSLRMTTKAAV